MRDDRSAAPKPANLQQQVQLLAKLKNNKPVNNHEEVQLQLQDLNFAKLNQTTTTNIERTNEQASTSEPVMPVKNNIAQIHCRQHCIKKWKEIVL
jgi:hypothetical protein